MKRMSLKKRFLFTFVVIVLSLLAGEVLVRCWFLVSGTPQSPGKLADETKELLAFTNQAIPSPSEVLDDIDLGQRQKETNFFIHPFQGWESYWGNRAFGDHMKCSRAGLYDDKYVIVTMGGSVAGHFQTSCWDYFVENLKKDPRFKDEHICVIRLARGAYKQPQQAIITAYLLAAGIEPDAIINIDGFNEVALGSENAIRGVYPLFPDITLWGPLAYSYRTGPEFLDIQHYIREHQRALNSLGQISLKYRLYYSGLLGRLVLWRMRSHFNDAINLYGLYMDKLKGVGGTGAAPFVPSPSFEVDEQQVIDLIVRAWTESSLSINAMCDAKSIYYLHVLQPTLHDEGAKPMSEEEIAKGAIRDSWKKGIELGYPKMREAGEMLKSRGVCYYDSSMVFKDVEETIYFDCCHFHGLGYEIFAHAVAEAFLKSLPPDKAD
ncbi:MAG: hypothetical protein ACYTG7_01095 [Planctomycetota bacterium]